jgi:SAM-dependent methyltransferase
MAGSDDGPPPGRGDEEAGPVYSFGTGDHAAERLEILARVFEPALADLLGEVDPTVTRVLDLGCGPGSSTASLARLLHPAELIGLDTSLAFLVRAAANVPDARFLEADVTEPWPVDPPDLAYARFLLAHLPDPVAMVGVWLGRLSPGGLLLIEETERIATEVAAYRDYLDITQALIDGRGATLYVGADLADRLDGAIVDRAFELDVSPADATAMFVPNLASWRTDPWVRQRYRDDELDELDQHLRRAAQRTRTPVRFTIRQIALRPPDPGS